MGMTRHDALAALAGQLNCRIAEFGEAEFRWRGRNCYSFNRIFLVTAGTGELVNHTGNQRFTLEAGYWYFMPTGLDLEFDFGPQLAFYSLHFQLELLAGCDVFGESRRCSRHRLDEELRRRCREAAAPAGSWRELFRLKALIFELAGASAGGVGTASGGAPPLRRLAGLHGPHPLRTHPARRVGRSRLPQPGPPEPGVQPRFRSPAEGVHRPGAGAARRI